MKDRHAFRQPQSLGDLPGDGNLLMQQQFAAGLQPLFDEVSGKAGPSRDRMVEDAPVHESAAPLFRAHQAAHFQMAECLANGEAAHAEPLHQFGFRRKPAARRELAGGDLRDKRLTELMPEGGPGLAFDHGHRNAQPRFSSRNSSLCSAG
jgi:hypothetical protein